MGSKATNVVDRLSEALENSNSARKENNITIRKTFPVSLITAGVISVLKVVGIANISWWAIGAIALFPLLVVLGLLAAILAAGVAVFVGALACYGAVAVGQWVTRVFKRFKGSFR